MRQLFPKFKHISFKRKLLAYSLLLSVVPVLLLGSVSSYIAAQSVQEEVDHNHQIILKQIQYQVDTFLRDMERSSIQLATNLAIEKSIALQPSMENLDVTLDMKKTLKKSRSYSDINYDTTLVYNKFDLVYSNRYGVAKLSEFPYREIIESYTHRYDASVVIIPPDTIHNQKELLFMTAVPLSGATPDGIVILHVSVKKLMNFLERVNLGEGRKLLVVDDEGKVVISTNVEEIGTRLTTMTDLYYFWTNQEELTNAVALGGVNYSLSGQKSAFNDWTYIAMTPAKELTQRSESIILLTWTMILVLTALWVFVAIVASRRLYRPILRLTEKFSSESKAAIVHTDGLQALDSVIHNMKTINEHLKSELNEQRPYLKENIFQQLLWGQMKENDIRKKTERYEFLLKGSWFFVCIVEVDQFLTFRQSFGEKDRALMLYALRKIVEEVCVEQMSGITVSTHPGQVSLIVGVENVNEVVESKVRDVAVVIREMVKDYFDFTVTVTISTARKGYGGISDAYQEALSLLSYRLLIGHNTTIAQAEIKPSIKQSSRVLVKLQRQIVSSVAEGNMDKAKCHLSEMFACIPNCAQNSETVLGLVSYLIREIDNMISEMGYEMNSFFESDPYRQLYNMTCLEEVEAWFVEDILPSIEYHIERLNISKQKKTIQQVLLYIASNFDQDISLQHAADEFQISPSRLSRVFKEETGYNFSEYVIHYRIEKAKEWLVHTEMPIKDIAERLRYTTVQNFTRVFKRVCGLPPGQYRKESRCNVN